MPRTGKTQWDFGELFPPEQFRKIYTVTELTSKVRRLLETEFGRIWVGGEISNLRVQGSGHIYFTLKDGGAQLSCVLFRGEAQAARHLIQDGQKVNLQGELTVYEPRGQHQLRVVAVEALGFGALQAAFERLKQKLQAEGLFAPERKRPLARFPQRVGLVTSASGAALQDVLHVVARRNPALELVLVSCRVQGEGAADEIAAGIALLNDYNAWLIRNGAPGGLLDLILVTRGGGSIEDLWAFNEEVVARAVAASALPVVSAVGHEIDFTVCDFVADVRAATPSAAAEIITEGIYSSGQFLRSAAGRLGQLVRRQLDAGWDNCRTESLRLARLHPRRRLEDLAQRLDEFQGALARCAVASVRANRLAWQGFAGRLLRVRPAAVLNQRREALTQARGRLLENARRRLNQFRERSESLQARLRLLGPQQTLARGYSITFDAKSGRVCRNAAELRAGQRLRTRLQEGEVRSRVEAGE